jgi:hypothetical protein
MRSRACFRRPVRIRCTLSFALNANASAISHALGVDIVAAVAQRRCNISAGVRLWKDGREYAARRGGGSDPCRRMSASIQVLVSFTSLATADGLPLPLFFRARPHRFEHLHVARLLRNATAGPLDLRPACHYQFRVFERMVTCENYWQ